RTSIFPILDRPVVRRYRPLSTHLVVSAPVSLKSWGVHSAFLPENSVFHLPTKCSKTFISAGFSDSLSASFFSSPARPERAIKAHNRPRVRPDQSTFICMALILWTGGPGIERPAASVPEPWAIANGFLGMRKGPGNDLPRPSSRTFARDVEQKAA